MFTNFNFDYFPYVIVKLNETIKDDDDFNYFLNKWEELYKNKKNFIFIFDTQNVGFPPIKYCYKLTMFIKELKKQKIQYLEKSYIIVKSNNVKHLLNLIFKIQSPIADVYLTDTNVANILSKKNINIINHFKPSDSFFSFF